MGLVSQRVKGSELETGDHIYTWRTALTYSHHGIYVGENKVVHFTHDRSGSSGPYFSSSDSDTRADCLDIPECGFTKAGHKVVMSCFNCFLGNGSLHRYEYGVNKATFLAKIRGGTCTTAKPGPPESVVHRAMYLLREGFGNYDLLTNNCEDLALYCKTGHLVRSKKRDAPIGASGQAASAMGVTLAAAVVLPLILVCPSPGIVFAASAVTYSFSRYATDIGVRDDVVDDKVEDMRSA